jgi:L-alanine-DL-glutamate epimerase-like enolase superfamily enzyme
MRFRWRDSWLGLRNSRTRIPFRYGSACLTSCPQALLSVTLEVQGRVCHGYSGDCLPPSWFDKTPGRGYRQQIDDMLASTASAQAEFATAAADPRELFPTWLDVYRRIHDQGAKRGDQPLLTSFGLSLVERAVMDALARCAGLSLAQALRENVYAIDAGRVHPELKGLSPGEWLAQQPSKSIFVRHTVGLGDPLTDEDLNPGDRIDDGLPQTLEQYIRQTGTRYFKVKVSNRLEADRARLLAIADLARQHLGDDYRLTLDGNEQYKQAREFDGLIDLLQTESRLATLFENIIAIEQPLERGIALSGEHTEGIRDLSRSKPVIIDESDALLESYPRALELGYRGVSSKNCKGPIKSVLNAGLTWLRNQRGTTQDYLITGEDLCTVGVVPVQSDLCLVAALGLTHVERNGHHYHPGLSYLDRPQQEAALRAHGDLYRRAQGLITPAVRDGRFAIESLQCRGYGFAIEPDLEAFEAVDTWRYDSLGIAD